MQNQSQNKMAVQPIPSLMFQIGLPIVLSMILQAAASAPMFWKPPSTTCTSAAVFPSASCCSQSMKRCFRLQAALSILPSPRYPVPS